MVKRIVSGGQSGVDRAALDVAEVLGLERGGWCPKGRWAEDGPIPESYPLKETRARSPSGRTRANVRDSDATLILTDGAPTGGTRLTLAIAEQLKRPTLCVDFSLGTDIKLVQRWIRESQADVLNVAGPRESNAPGIYDMAHGFLVMALKPWANGKRRRQP